jgi:hypothetical protein
MAEIAIVRGIIALVFGAALGIAGGGRAVGGGCHYWGAAARVVG